MDADETGLPAAAPLSQEAGREAPGGEPSRERSAREGANESAGPSGPVAPRRPLVQSVGIAPGPEKGRVPWGLVSTALLAVLGFAGAVPAASQLRRRVRPGRRAAAATAPDPPPRPPATPPPTAAAPGTTGQALAAPAMAAPGTRPKTAPPTARSRHATVSDPVGPVAVVAVATVRGNGHGNPDPVAAPSAPASPPPAPRTAPPAPAAQPHREGAPPPPAEQMRSLRLEARLATVSLTLLPVLVTFARGIADPSFLPRMLTSVVGLLVLLVATLLSVVGAWWLSGLHLAPFPAWPWKRREHARRWAAEEQLAATLESPAGLARRGLSLGDAVERGVAPQVALASSAAQLRLVRQRRLAHRHARLPVTALLPFVACLLPATILLAVVGW